MAAGGDRRSVGLGAFELPAAGDVSYPVDSDVETGVVQPLDEVLASLAVRLGAGENGAPAALRRVDRAELRGRLDIRAEPLLVYW
jgi:hypothetical protein